jgi:hypothetical protein
MVQECIAHIADIRDRHKLKIIIRDKASELKSKDLTDHFESLGFQNYYSGSIRAMAEWAS